MSFSPEDILEELAETTGKRGRGELFSHEHFTFINPDRYRIDPERRAYQREYSRWYVPKWRAANPEKVREQARRRWARIRSNRLLLAATREKRKLWMRKRRASISTSLGTSLDVGNT